MLERVRALLRTLGGGVRLGDLACVDIDSRAPARRREGSSRNKSQDSYLIGRFRHRASPSSLSGGGGGVSAAAFASSAITMGAPARQPRARSPARPAPLGRWSSLAPSSGELSVGGDRSWTYPLAGPKEHSGTQAPSAS